MIAINTRERVLRHDIACQRSIAVQIVISAAAGRLYNLCARLNDGRALFAAAHAAASYSMIVARSLREFALPR